MTASPGEPNAERGIVHIIDRWHMTVTVPSDGTVTNEPLLRKPGEPIHWTTYLGLPHKQLPKLALEYVDVLSKATTDQLCTCTWIETQIHGKIQKKRDDEDLLCPQHSRVGFILGFFEWAFRNTDDELSKWRDISGDNDDQPSTVDSQ